MVDPALSLTTKPKSVHLSRSSHFVMAQERSYQSTIIITILLAQGITLTVGGTVVSDTSNTKLVEGGTQRGNDSNRPLQLAFSGEADRRLYYVEPNFTMTWSEAKVYCRASNLYLASIATKAQHDLLIRTLEPFGEHISYWTSLRLPELTPDMLKWDETSQRPDTTFLARFYFYVTKPEICATYYHRNAGQYIPSMDIHVIINTVYYAIR